MKLDNNPDAPLNLGWANQVLQRFFRHNQSTPEMQALFAEFKKYWQLQLDLNQSFRARQVHAELCEKYVRKIFDTFARRDAISV